MTEIIPLLICLEPHLSSTLVRQLCHISFAMLCNPNRATMLGLSRWTEKGGSYRTLQRFYQTPINWLRLHWTFMQTQLLSPEGDYILAADEVVVSKAGKKTYGVGRFYSGLARRVIPSVSFLAVSLIDVQQRRSYPVQVEQLMPPSKTKPSDAPQVKRPPGRPKGSKNYVKSPPQLTPQLLLLQRMIRGLQAHWGRLSVKHIVLDGKFGNYPSTWAISQTGLHIISKMRHDAALYLPYSGPKPARGATPRYGDKLNYAQLPAQYLVSTTVEDDYRIETDQMSAYHKDYPDCLNVVVVVKAQLTTGRCGHVVLFSTDLNLTAAQIVDYYSLRFQIEFNFRDAKQHWGLEDFMNVSPQAVTNAVNLAFLMVNLSHAMLTPYRSHDPEFSVLDLKARFRAHRYLTETIKLLPNPPDEHLISRIWQRLTTLGGIRTGRAYPDAA
jgi:DDE superfamily endonuclease